MIRMTVTNGVQVLTELCEHCGETIKTLHISEVTTRHPNDPRAITIKDAANADLVVKSKTEWITEKSASYIREGLLDEGEATASRAAGKFKWGVRPEAMCSQSIDPISETSQSYCYRSSNTKFLAKYSSSFHAASEKENTLVGSKVGMDRKGRVIRVKAEKKFKQADSDIKYKGPEKTSWYRSLNDDDRTVLINRAHGCPTYIERYGREVKTMEVVYRYENQDAMLEDLDANECE